MDKPHFNELLQKLQEGTLTPTERSLLESWYTHYASQSSNVMAEEDLELSVSSLRDQLQLDRKPFIIKLWTRIAIASAIACMVIGVYFFRASFIRQDDRSKYITADIDPGKNGATLTLANGTKILINDALTGDIANQSGVRISKTKDGQIIYEITEQSSGKLEYNTLSTTRGEQTQVRLPDGSLVFLNATSSLKYPTSFAKSAQRRVSLTGEGYFEIAKDKVHPFIVESSNQEIEVLGTHFNVNAYVESPGVATTLLEGSVKVSVLRTHKGQASKEIAFLKPNQQASVVNHSIKVTETDAATAIAWKEGYFRFQNASIEDIMLELSRWYNIEVVYQGEMTRDGFNGKISRFRNISEVLKMLENTELVRFKVEGRRVIVLR